MNGQPVRILTVTECEPDYAVTSSGFYLHASHSVDFPKHALFWFSVQGSAVPSSDYVFTPSHIVCRRLPLYSWTLCSCGIWRRVIC